MNPSRKILSALASALAVAAGARAADSYFIKIYYDGKPGRLAETSFVPYAATNDYALGEVGSGYADILRREGWRLEILADDVETKNFWDVRLPVTALPPSADIVYTFGRDHYLVTTPHKVYLPPSARAVHLRPDGVDFFSVAKPTKVITFQRNDEVSEIVGAVNKIRYEFAVRDLADFGTRFSYSEKCKEASYYLRDKLELAGLTVFRDRFIGTDINAVAAPTSSCCWFGGDLGVVAKTVTGGAEWEVWQAFQGEEILALAAADADIAWVGTDAGNIFKTADGGNTWVKINLGDDAINDLFFLDTEHGWAVTSAGDVFATEDGGENWIKRAALGKWLRGIAFGDTQKGVVCGSGGFIATTADGGITWEVIPGTPNLRLESVAYRTPTEIFVVGEGGAVFRSADGGETWKPQEFASEVYLRTAAFKSGVGYIAGGIGHIWRTADGVNWFKLSPPPYVIVAAAAPAPDKLWCATAGGAALFTSDGGNTWSDHAAKMPQSSPFVWDNIWSEKKGTGEFNAATLITSHYDSIATGASIENPNAPAPGADDNASGTAAVLEFAWASRTHTFRGDVILACFAGEEQGLRGSSHFVPKLVNEGREIRGVINMDMVAYADKSPEDADLVTNHASLWLAEYTRLAAQTYVPELGFDFTVDDTAWRSDHAPFWRFGYPAYLMIDDWQPTYPYYHTPQDTPDKLDFDFGANMVRAGIAAAASLASPTRTPASSPLANVKVYPNPFKASAHVGRVFFANLPPRCEVRFYDLAGRLIGERHNGAAPVLTIEVEAAPRLFKSSGVYIYLIESESGETTTGKLAVIF